MSLREIIGQEKAVEILLGVMGRQRVATSYLFCGESGIGKKTTAVNFAKALNCLKTASGDKLHATGRMHETEQEVFEEIPYPTSNTQPSTSSIQHRSHLTDFDACDACESCMKIAAGAHPDFLMVVPEENQIRIEEVRAIDNALSFKAFEGRKKIVIVDDADAMNIAAANAFLKTLEEPPEDSVIILASSRPERIQDTIRSRCSRINFVPLSEDACRTVLCGRVPDEGLDLAVRLSMGRPGLALSGDLADERTWFIGLLKAMLNAEKDSWASRDDSERWLELALTVLRDMAVLKITGQPSRMINTDFQEYLDTLSKQTDVKVIISLYNEINILKNLLMFNLNKSITWNYTSSLLRKEITV